MNLKNLIAKEAKKVIAKTATKGVVGETLPVKPTVLVRALGARGKLAAVAAAAVALIAALSKLV